VIPKSVFAFFGHPGAGKSTLCRRFGELLGVPAFDTDPFMTAAEVEAIGAGRYTQEMRLANIRRYSARARELLETHACVALADGLPNDGARRFLRDSLPEARVVFVLVRAPRALWERRLEARRGSPVSIGVAEAEAYVAENWEEPSPSFEFEVVENGDDPAAVDSDMRGLNRRYVEEVGAGAGS
jgi:predicted kinase